MKSFLTKSILTIAAGGALLFAGATSASAVTLYDNVGYYGDQFSGNSAIHVGNMSDRASSIKAYGRITTYYDNQNYGGYSFKSSADFFTLKDYRAGGLPWNIDWNDRITSLR